MTTIIEKFIHQAHYTNNERDHLNMQLYLPEIVLDIKGIDSIEVANMSNKPTIDTKRALLFLKNIVAEKTPVIVESDEPSMFNFTVTIALEDEFVNEPITKIIINCHMLNQSGF